MNQTDPTAPIRKSSLPTTPPPEWEFHTWFPHPDGGGDMVPGERQRGILVRRRVTYSDWEPVRPDHWADEPKTDVAAASAVASPPTNRAAWLTEAADIAERLMDERYGPDCSYAIGGLDVARELRRLAVEAHDTGTQQPVRPARGDQFEAWLKTQRDAATGYTDAWNALDDALDQYRLHADTGTPLDQHACEEPHCDCPRATEPAPVAQQPAALVRSGDATVDPAMCPRCKGDNSEAFELCTACAQAEQQAAAADGEETRVTVYLSTPCDACGHTLNWHRNDVGCTVEHCVCSRFQPPAEEPRP